MGVWPLDVGNQWILTLEDLTGIPVDGESTIPHSPLLYQNYPNPFNASTTIEFDIETPGDTRLEVYNLMGQKVATLIDDYLESGPKTVAWDASEFSSGVYFYKLNTGNEAITRRMTLLK